MSIAPIQKIAISDTRSRSHGPRQTGPRSSTPSTRSCSATHEPARRHPATATRFKLWWHLAGSAVEHAAALCSINLDFRNLFLKGEEDDTESVSLGAFAALRAKYGHDRFTAAQLARLINSRDSDFSPQEDRDLGEQLLQLLYPGTHTNPTMRSGRRPSASASGATSMPPCCGARTP